MKRRLTNQSDSLDLLLDTICNLFGLIILITIIIAILAQLSGEETIEKLKNQSSGLENLKNELESIDNYKIELENKIQVIQTSELMSAIITASKAKRMLARAKAELERRKMFLEEETNLISDEQKLIQTMKDQEPLLRDQIEMLESELKRSKELKDIQLRTPKRRELAEHMPVQVILKENRVFIINDTSGWSDAANPKAERCRVWTTWNASSIDTRKSKAVSHNCYSAGGQDIEREIYLLSNSGIIIPTDKYIEREPEWLSFLDSLDPSIHVVSLKVDPDSFVGFSEVRRSLTKASFHYDVTPKVITTPYLDRIRDDQNATAQ